MECVANGSLHPCFAKGSCSPECCPPIRCLFFRRSMPWHPKTWPRRCRGRSTQAAVRSGSSWPSRMETQCPQHANGFGSHLMPERKGGSHQVPSIGGVPKFDHRLVFAPPSHSTPHSGREAASIHQGSGRSMGDAIGEIHLGASMQTPP